MDEFEGLLSCEELVKEHEKVLKDAKKNFPEELNDE